MYSFLVDLKAGSRVFRRNRGFAFTCLLALAVGVGVSTAMFSVLYAIVLKPFPFPGQEQLMVAWKADPKEPDTIIELSYPEYRDLREQAKSFEDVAAMPTTSYGYSYVITGRGESRQIESARVSGNFFSVLRVQPSLGRIFRPDEDRIGADPVVVLTDAFWRSEFGSDQRAIGSFLVLSGTPFTIIGVLPSTFEFPKGVDVFTPLGTNPLWVDDRDAVFLQIVGRLKPGISRERARVELNIIVARTAKLHPETDAQGQVAIVQSLPVFITGTTRTVAYLLFAASTILFVIAVVNLASLLGTRAVAREGEAAIRTALGATRIQLFKHYATEAFFLSAVGALLGLGISWTIIQLVRFYAPHDIPRLAAVSLDRAGVSFAFGSLLLATFLLGLVPLLLLRNANLQTSMRNFSTTVSPNPRSAKFGPILLVLQISSTLALLVVAGTVGRSVRNLQKVRLGYNPENVFTCSISLGSSRYATPNSKRFLYKELLNDLRAKQEVVSAGAVLVRPLEGPVGWDTQYVIPGQNAAEAKRNPTVNFEVVTPSYFAALGTPLVAGRDFRDGEDGSKPHTALVSERVAIQMYGSLPQALGRQFNIVGDSIPLTIIGVVQDARYRRLTQSQGDIFVSYEQFDVPVRYIILRTRSNPENARSLVRAELYRLDPTQAVSKEATMKTLVTAALAQDHFYSTLLTLFAVCATVLAAIGSYGVVSDMALHRLREFGIRIALGAQARTPVKILLWSTFGWITLGELSGIIVGGIATTIVKSNLFGVSSFDVPSIVTTSTVLLFISLIACVPALLKVANLDPNRLLRES